jgi:hypothetical protein
VARATDKDLAVTTQATSVGQLIGTVQYMSPEQCDGDPNAIDTRSDVYSLGVVLYELLTGGLPYEATGVALLQATQAIKEALPRRPSGAIGWHGRLARELRGDIDTIVLKALEKDREKRFASAADLAQDIRRHLKGEPIEARSPTAWSRTVRWVVRHPVWVTVAVCVLFAAATGVATWATVWFVNSRPARAVVIDGGREAQLLALDRRVVRSWSTPHRTSVGFAELVLRPAALGGDRLLLLGFEAGVGNPYTPGLDAYDADGALERPEWVGRLEEGDIPSALKQRTDYSFTPETFGASQVVVADVLGDLPGESQVVVVHQHVLTTHGAVRVYDLRGTVLYQVWVDCRVYELYWMRGPRLLVLAGHNGEAFWEERGERNARASHPCVVLALRPEHDFRRADYVVQESADWDRADPRLRPVWYKCVLPAEASSRGLGGMLSAPNQPWNDREFVDFGMHVHVPVDGPMADVSIHWVLGKDGEPVAGPNLGDTYRRNQMLPDGDPRKLPPIDWHLGDLPPIQARAGDTAGLSP